MTCNEAVNGRCPGVIVLLLYFEGVSRLMISDLEAEKAVDPHHRR